MANIKLTIVVPNLPDVIALFDVIKVHRSVTGVNGPFTEITTPATRMALRSDKTVYEYTDAAGLATYYYRISYFNSLTLAESSQSDPQLGADDPALGVLSVEELKTNYLFGLDLTDDSSNDMPVTLYQWYIKAAVSWIERRLDIPLRPLVVTDEQHDFYVQDYYKYIRLQLDNYPIISVEAASLVLPGEQKVMDFPVDWIYPDVASGQIEIIPGQGAASMIVLGQTGAWLPMVYGWTDYIPKVFRVTYTAGFSADLIPDELRDVVGMAAAIGPLSVAGDLIIGAGIAAESLSLDGISQAISSTASATNSGYGARIINYNKLLKERIRELRRYYKGIRMTAA